jgi:hypothetical protein
MDPGVCGTNRDGSVRCSQPMKAIISNQHSLHLIKVLSYYDKRTVVDGIMAPRDVYILIPQTCKYVTLCDKRDFAYARLW